MAQDVRWIQQFLIDRGFDPGPVDGINGPRTRAAMREFQQWLRDQGHDPGAIDGVWGPATQGAFQRLQASGAPTRRGAEPPGAAPPAAPNPLAAPPQSAKAVLATELAKYGLQNMGDWAWNQYLSGKPMEQVMLELRDTPEYKARFKGMAALSKSGQAISEAEYIATERQMAEIMHAYGLPPGFYDSPDDFADFIGKRVSPMELQRRLDVRQQVLYEMPDETREFMKSYYGLTDGTLLAWVTDEKRALPIIEKMVRTADVAGDAARAGLRPLSLKDAEQFSELPAEEIQRRIDLYVAASAGSTIEDKRELARLYGVTDLTGEVTDPDKAVGVIQQQLEAAFTSGAAVRTGFGGLTRQVAEKLSVVGVDDRDFQAVTQAQELFQELPGEAGVEGGGRDAQIKVLEGNQQARNRVEKTRAKRVAEFEGGGSFAKDREGIAGLRSSK